MHCASHRLNLVINDQNEVIEIRNAVGVIKTIIVYFRESSLRRQLVTHIPLLCETRWSEKYKSIRLFYEHFQEIFIKLEELAVERNQSSESRQRAYQLIHSIANSSFLICLTIIAKYSAMLEPIAKSFQAINTDFFGARNQIISLTSVISMHRENAEVVFREDIFAKVDEMSKELHLELSIPRTVARQCYGTNTGMRTTNAQEYFQQAIFIPYLDSILTSLRLRFDDSEFIPSSLLTLHPIRAVALTRENFKVEVARLDNIYKLDNFFVGALTWYDMWKHSNEAKNIEADLTLEELVINHCSFYPAIRHALLIALTLPSTTCTVERSFSTLRRVKTWLRATMGESRTSGLCMVSVHRKKIQSTVDEFIKQVTDKFALQPRRLQFLFSDDT